MTALRSRGSGSGPPAPVPAARRRPGRSQALRAALFLAPALAFFATFVLYPVALTAYYSLLHWDGLSPPNWAGLSNYTDLWHDPVARQALRNAVVLLVFYSVLPIGIGLIVASVLARVSRGRGLLRTVLFVPQVIAPVVVAVGWQLIYNPSDGLLNEGLRRVGLGSLRQTWLGDFTFALPSVGVVATWATYGLTMVLFLAGLQRIPPVLYEAARMDGAGAVREFTAITLPGLRSEILVALVVTMISAFRNFDLVWSLTGGGPGNATDVPVLEVYRRAFLNGQVGSGSAMGILIAVVVMASAATVLALGRRRM